MNRTKRSESFAFIGGILGIPLSFYLQRDIVQKIGLRGYIKGLFDLIKRDNDVLVTLIVSIAIFSFIGYLIGKYQDKSEKNE
jgi:ABC-type phosphate/phosphonate transport system permease subunit